jgi:topoisomerase-4 subunit A
VHYDGKSKNYMVKRVAFENTAVGRQTSIISEEAGSKMLLISGAMQTIIKVEQLKGATKIPETVELNLADLIDVKGMKAMGNRLSAHVVQSVTLLSEHDDAEDVPDPEPESVADTEIIITPEDKTAADIEPDNSKENTVLKTTNTVSITPQNVPKTDAIASSKPESAKSPEKALESPEKKPVEPQNEKSVESPTPPKKIDFEITNPDDIDIDDKGQLGLF